MLVSIAMAVYNGGEYLQEAVDSILNQSYREIEVIIVDDGSKDNSREILDQIRDERVKIIHLEKNQGAANALNIAIERARGEWIAIHDADDISYPNRIEEQVKFIVENPGLVAVGSFIECIGDNEASTTQAGLKGLENFINRSQTTEEIKQQLCSACPLTHGTMFFSKKAFYEVGKYNSDLKITYDYELWTRLILKGPILKIPNKLYKYRVYSNSLTNKNLSLTIRESFRTCAKYIRKNCYQTQKSRPTMVLFGLEKSSLEFAKEAKGHLKIVKIINKRKRNYLKKLIKMFNDKELAGVVILSSYKFKRETHRYLLENGMELNKNLFVYWVWWKE